ncbi:hypothetical protein Tco_0177084, partial [Tanacetum coccineum]
EEHEMHDNVQPNYVVDSHAYYTSDSNMIPYDQYVKDNAVPSVQSNVSFVLNDAYMMIYNDIIVITDRNIKEENLEKELHSVKLQLASTINHNKSMVEEVMSSKKDFKQKENKYLEEFLDMKALKEKVEDKLYKQDHTPVPTEPSGHEESSSLYAELGLTDSETESDDDVSPEINPEAQDEGQA